MRTEDKSGQVLDDRYRLVRMLGVGGMGSVYLGTHLKLGRDVAVKLLHADLAGNEDVVRRFYREAQTAAAIRHSNIIDVLDVGTAPWGEPYLVMEYLEGENLADLLARAGPLDLPTAFGILEPVLLALSSAHEMGVVHRDLKPENIFISQRKGESPTIKLIDFGISKFVGGGDKTRLTQTGFMLGTPAYMSPEQARGQTDVDHLSDVYSCGVILYEMLTGDLPFVGQNYNELLVNILTEEPRSPLQVRRSFPRVAEAIVMRALGKESENRFASAADMLAALEPLPGFEQRGASLARLASSRDELSCATGDLGDTIAIGTPSAWTPPTTAGTQRRWRGPLLIAVALGAIGVLGVAAMMILLPILERDPAPVEQEIADDDDQYGVLIAVEGTPPGAVVFYEGTEMPQNPFPVDKKHTISVVRIEADGYTPVQVGVLPTEDRTVKVSMVPIGMVDTDATVAAVVVDGISEAHREAGRKHRKSAARKAGKKAPVEEVPPKKDEQAEDGDTPPPARVLTRQEIQAVMGPFMAAVGKRCTTETDATVDLKLRVDGTGKVLHVKTGPSAGGAVGDCIASLAQLLSFPAYGGPPLGLSYTLELEGSKAEQKPEGKDEGQAEVEAEELPATLSQAQIAAVMARVTNKARARCMEVSGGTVQVAFAVLGSGRVENARATGPLAGTETGKCVASTVQNATFPEFSDPRIDISYPIVLGDKPVEEPPPEPPKEPPPPPPPDPPEVPDKGGVEPPPPPSAE
jgi:hypothetical protein